MTAGSVRISAPARVAGKYQPFGAHDLSAFRMMLSTSALLPERLPGRLIERGQARAPGNPVEFHGVTEGGVPTIPDRTAHPGKSAIVGRAAPACDVAGIAVSLDSWGDTPRDSAIEFRADLPRRAIGKVLKRALRAPCQKRASA
jgi:acyl-coenzyme A synthetase/AMP-(fatty) acid ligase